MKICVFDVPGVKLFVPKRMTDPRGSFSEFWADRWFCEEIADVAFVQDNLSVSTRKGTVRGLHFQKPPLLRQIGAHPARIHFGRRGGVTSYYSPSHNAGVL
jgi:dTDP-4-dehydrorhamnose 3,5-epimerase-like enzyme